MEYPAFCVDFQQVRRLWGPGSAYSALIGFCAQSRVPSAIRAPAYRAFARAVGANLDETELPLDAYPTLGDFFARKLRDGARTIDSTPDAVISPCDGVIAARGKVTMGALVQAKGKSYELGQLVADYDFAADLVEGEYITVYLSPRDYHRVHAPIAAELVGYDFVPGALWPVNPVVAARRGQLLSRNERVVIRMKLDDGRAAALVMVGAAGVGNMRLGAWASGFQSAELRPTGAPHHVELSGIRVARGDELGAFHLGSTVVLVFGRGAVRLDGQVGQGVQFGELLGKVTRPA